MSPTPLKNGGVKVSWDDELPNIWKNKDCSKAPTRKCVFLPKANQLGMKKRNHKIQHLVTPASMMPFPVDIDKKSHEPNHPKSMIFEVVASETERTIRSPTELSG